ncbi:hypothetical protein BC835DRAFT_1521852 [Cytidiella melzeri]|nr:hypothetical protein BC835DRAFT_1521852 [Cytidiella melzeri]
MSNTTHKIDLKAAAAATLLDPEDWESLIQDKEWKISLESKEYHYALRSEPRPIGSSIEMLNNTAVGRSLSGLVGATSGVIRALVSYVDRAATEYQVKLVLNRFAKGDGCGGRYVGDAREELLKLHSATLKGRYSMATKVKVSETRLTCLSTYLASKPQPVEPLVYKDLVELLSLVCTDEYPKPLFHRVCDVFSLELRLEGGARSIASALVECDAGDVYLILRHLATSHILAWSSVAIAHRAIQSEADARQAARKISFSRDTYDGYLRATEGFHKLIRAVLIESPSLVHAAFDDAHLHLLWLKYLSTPRAGEDAKTLKYTWAVDNLISTLLEYPKRLRPELPLELDCLALFMSTTQDGNFATQLAAYIADSIAVLGRADSPWDSINAVYRDHPTLNTGKLAHAVLPFFMFGARLLRESRVVAEKAIEHDIVESLCGLWCSDFPLIKGRYTGVFVNQDKRKRAMRIATTLVIGALATHQDLYPQLCRRITATKSTQQWFWDAVAFLLALRAQFIKEKWCTEACAAIKPLAFCIMSDHNLFPGDVDREAAVTEDSNMVWILQASGNPSVDSRLRTFALDVLISRMMAPAYSWHVPVSILMNCQPEEQAALQAALSEFIEHFLRAVELEPKRYALASPTLRSTSTSLAYALNPYQQGANESPAPDSSQDQPAFMSNPLDRFVMFVSNASRRNVYVAHALAESNVLEFVRLLLAGRFDTRGLDRSSKDWRRRTCAEILAQKRIWASLDADV